MISFLETEINAKQFVENKSHEAIDLYKDIIDTKFENRDFEAMRVYIDRLKKQFDIDYNPEDKTFTPIVSLDKIYNKKDFHFYNEYIDYCEELFVLRFNTFKKYITDKYAFKSINLTEIQRMLSKEGIEVKEVNRPSDTAIAFVSGNSLDIAFNTASEFFDRDKIILSVLIHEMGHVFENKERLYNKELISHQFNYKSSSYLMNPSEILADHFMNYYLENKYLKIGWPEVERELKNLIPKNIDLIIKAIMKASV